MGPFELSITNDEIWITAHNYTVNKTYNIWNFLQTQSSHKSSYSITGTVLVLMKQLMSHITNHKLTWILSFLELILWDKQ